MTVQEAIEKMKEKFCCEKEPCKFCRDACMYGENHCEVDMAIQALEEVEQYRALGTVEELKEAREKQVAKKPEKLGKERSIENSYWIKCECGAISLADIKTHNQMYCSECGQLMTLDWSEEDD